MTVEDILQTVNSTWGYENTKPEAMSRRKECFTFSSGLLWDDGLLWRKAVRKWCARGLEDYDDLKSLMIGEQVHPALRRCLQDARLGLMLGDHYLSSLPASSDQSRWGARSLRANTDRKTGKPKQFLEEHLVGVMKQSLAIVHRLPAFASRMEKPMTYILSERQVRLCSAGRIGRQPKSGNTGKAEKEIRLSLL